MHTKRMQLKGIFEEPPGIMKKYISKKWRKNPKKLPKICQQ